MKRQSAQWSRQRQLAVTAALLLAIVFIAANIHLVVVSIASMPACVAPTADKQSAMLRVAKPAC